MGKESWACEGGGKINLIRPIKIIVEIQEMFKNLLLVTLIVTNLWFYHKYKTAVKGLMDKY